MRQKNSSMVSRRGFIALTSGLLSGLLLLSPRRLAENKDTYHLIYHSLNIDGARSFRPQKNPSFLLWNSDNNINTLYKNGDSRPLFALNQVARTIWDECDGRNTLSDISHIVHQRYQVSHQQSYNDCYIFFKQMQSIGAIRL